MKNNHPDRLQRYSIHYSKESFWKKIRKYTEKQGRKPVYYALLLYYLLEDKDVPVTHKATIIGALGYFILPLDFIPDITPLIGFTDDLTALTACLKSLYESITPAIKEKARKKIDSLILEIVSYIKV